MNNLNIIFLVPIGILHNMIFHNISDIVSCNNIEKKLIFLLISGVMSIIIGKYFINSNAIKYGLYFGGILLLYYTLIMNWDIMDKYVKIILIGIVFCYVIWFSVKTKKY